MFSNNDRNKVGDKVAFYQEVKLVLEEVQFLVALEVMLGQSIPILAESNPGNAIFGFTAKDRHVTGLWLKDKNLYSLPNSIHLLTKVETLELSGNAFNIHSEFVNAFRKLMEEILGRPIRSNVVKNEVALNSQSKLISSPAPENQRIKTITIIFNSKEKRLLEEEINKELHARSVTHQERRCLKDRLHDILEMRKIFEDTLDDAKKKPLQGHSIGDSSPTNKEACSKCGDQNLRCKSLLLDLVRKSPRKLVFVILKLTITCDSCKFDEIVSNIDAETFGSLLNSSEVLARALRHQARQNFYCSECDQYYKERDQCEVHKTPIKPPKLLFIRGINMQYATSKIL
ncbi:MAG: hypothetical protein JW891_02680 [Candidatus Lokiarchaeota archaeon]|nr:hypothetical protein [Candidatus Lokiarchaeota archaeon]